MILGVGIDLVEMKRIRKLHLNRDFSNSFDRLVDRVLTPLELQIFQSRCEKNLERGLGFLATRYAAKEAFSKAMGCGIGADFSFQDLSVLNALNGKPELHYSMKLKEWMDSRSAVAFISVSDEFQYAVANVIISKQ